ncbi:hypothetical protein Vlu01_12860 [Micromonospora lutea]|uniref:Secreted protein n=1 Tax=Micromonospora lutea TaxID=419825 RepID=A0ABQ4IRX8_9ACTN|nr:hypothetical protein Vlu01_12860 [Micromonospora lutea]
MWRLITLLQSLLRPGTTLPARSDRLAGAVPTSDLGALLIVGDDASILNLIDVNVRRRCSRTWHGGSRHLDVIVNIQDPRARGRSSAAPRGRSGGVCRPTVSVAVVVGSLARWARSI